MGKNDTTGQRTKSAIKNLKEQAPNLKNIEFYNKSFTDIKVEKVNNLVIYLDPPYKDTKQYMHKIDYDIFYEFCRVLSKNNKVFISEYNMPNDFECIWEKQTKVTIDKNCKDSNINRIERLFICKI